MKKTDNLNGILGVVLILALFSSCNDKLSDSNDDEKNTDTTDYSISSDMVKPLVGAYADFYNSRSWTEFPLIALRGDDVNSGGLGDEAGFLDIDIYIYNNTYWAYNNAWQTMYGSILKMNGASIRIGKYMKAGANEMMGAQYLAEIKVMRSFLLLNLSRMWGKIFIPVTAQESEFNKLPLSDKNNVMKYISEEMDNAIPSLPDLNPSSRTDIPGGITRYTAYAIKALANLELNNYQVVADATSEIIKSGKYSLESDFFNLWNIHGKLNKENILEWQYSDTGADSQTNFNYMFSFFGPTGWSPAVKSAKEGWGYYEPSMKFIKFMLDRGEKNRLQATVLFTNRGIGEIRKDTKYATLPSWISNITIYNDTINDFNREMFVSGKYYYPSSQLTSGKTDYGSNKNFTCIRYSEILLMYAEALTRGARGSIMSADAAVNLVRLRAGLPYLSGVTNAQVMDEKLAELGTEWGTRFYDLVRLGMLSELNYDGRTDFSADKIFYPYPKMQMDLYSALQN